MVPLFREVAIHLKVGGNIVDNEVQWRRCGPSRVDTFSGGQLVRRETGREYVVKGGERFEILIPDFDHGDIISHKLTVLFSP